MQGRGAGRRPGKVQRAGKKSARKASSTRTAIDLPEEQLLERLRRERDEALELQAASAEVLRIIGSSPGDLKPVFEAMLGNALRICDAKFGHILLYDGERFHATHLHDVPPSYRAFWEKHGPIRPSPNTGLHRLARTKRVQHIPDLKADSAYCEREPLRVVTVEQAGARSLLCVPMLKESELVGAIVIYRQELQPFAEKQIELVQNFAAQAVIAIENTRLLTEIHEALERQTATTEVLQVINASPGDLTPVFDAILEKAHSLCAVAHGALQLYDGEAFRGVASRGLPETLAAHLRQGVVPGPNTPHRRLLEGARFAQVTNWAEIDNPVARASLDAGIRTTLFIPLRRERKLLGYIAAARQEVRPFAEKEIALLESFAAQAVIAMENARLLDEVRHRNNELAEALEFQTATGEVLRIVASSPENLQPVFDAMLEKAIALCAAKFGTLFLYDGNEFSMVADRNLPPQYAKLLRGKSFSPEANSGFRNLVESKAPLHLTDMFADSSYAKGEPLRVAAVQLGGVRSFVAVPLLRKGELIGNFSIYRGEPGGFGENQIALVTTFADQAVIAIENARLLTELRERTNDLSESLQQQTATSEVLQIISSSPSDLAPVFDKMLENATRVCGAEFGSMNLVEGDSVRQAALYNAPAALAEVRVNRVSRPHPQSSLATAIRTKQVIHLADLRTTPGYLDRSPSTVELVELGGARTVVVVPMLREDQVIGVITIYRQEIRPFDEKQIELVSNFAKQAVIAIENARLLGELRERQAELARSVDELSATGDVLKIISRSSVELETVLNTLVETAARLCCADHSNLFRRRDAMLHLVASWGLPSEARDFLLAHPLAADRSTLAGRVELERQPVHIADVLQDPEYTYREGQKIQGYRTMLGVPLQRGDALIGIFSMSRTRVEPFTSKEIELVNTFADQAVIAIENARLFDELRDRQAELRVTFDNMGDGVVMFGADTRLVAWNRNFQEILDLPDAFLAERPSYADYFRYLAERGEYSADLEAELSRTIGDTSRELRLERTRPDGRVIEVRRNPVPGGGFVLIFADITERKRAEQAIRAARDAAESALRELQTAQASLVHAQKMAALGQVTAGIAHEIKNPLNFVNNFAGLSVELLDELKDAAAKAVGDLDPGKRDEIVETIGMLTENLQKIVEHGRRADGIVRSMLQHSRGSSDDRQPTDLNALAEEALNLAYHGARAQDPNFDITVEHDLDRNLAPVDVVPQELTRVLLNLIGNGFYAANKRSRESDGTYRPALKVTTREFGESVEVRVRDNGVGVPLENRDKLFQPFFTTKPTGEGTGLGLSISYEVVTQQHGGTITVDSEVGDFTEFTVRLPRRGRMLTG